MTGETDVITKISHHPVASTVSVLTGLIEAKGMKLFAVIDQSAEARQAGLALRETTLVIFGSPAAGTPVMQESALSALDLPLKVLVWDDCGQTKLTCIQVDNVAWSTTHWTVGGGYIDNIVSFSLNC